MQFVQRGTHDEHNPDLDLGDCMTTYCVGCKMHRPVAEFVWAEDGQVVGS